MEGSRYSNFRSKVPELLSYKPIKVRSPSSEMSDKFKSNSRYEEDPLVSSHSMKDLSRLSHISVKEPAYTIKPQLASASEKALLSRNRQSPGLMRDYLNLIDGGQSEDLYKAHDRFRVNEEKHNQEAENLKLEVTTLREKIEQSTSKHKQTLKSLKDDSERRLKEIKESKEKELAVINTQILQFETEIDTDKRKSFISTEEISLSTIGHKEEESHLRSRVKNLTQEVNFLKDKLEGIYYRELSNLHKEINSIQHQNAKEVDYVRQEYQRQSDEYITRIRAKDNMLETLECEVSDLKVQYKSKFDNIQAQISQLESSLLQTQIEENKYHQRIEEIKSTRDNARKESEVLSEEAQILESKLQIEIQTNKDLTDKLNRLERIVYGKGHKVK